jgi:hypothetical protein
MNKTIEAFMRGYVLFDVNGQRFYRYNTALNERKVTMGAVEFKGWHVFKGWTTFYLRFTTEKNNESW